MSKICCKICCCFERWGNNVSAIGKLFREVLGFHLLWADSWGVIVSYPHARWLSLKYNGLLTSFPKEVIKAKLFARLKIRLDKTLGKVLRNRVAFSGRWKQCQLALPSVSPSAETSCKPRYTGIQSSHVATVNPVVLWLLPTELWVLWSNLG